jgi:undecaprenyl-diphosphatase
MRMTWWEALILGVVQGLTEFFPVSSSGHLVIGQELLGLQVPGLLFDVAVHIATLLSVLIVFRARIVELIRGALGMARESSWPYLLKIGLATLPAVVAGLTLKDYFEARFEDAVFAGTMILVTGCVVWSSRWAQPTGRFRAIEILPLGMAALFALLAGTIAPFLTVLGLQAAIMTASRMGAPAEPHGEPTWGGALIMGIAQSLAILPGISRSGSTVMAALWRRITPAAAAEFSFLMSIPAILGALVLQVPDVLRAEEIAVSWTALLVGGTAAAISGIIAIRFFIAMLKRQNFYIFAIYCWVAAGLFLLLRAAPT